MSRQTAPGRAAEDYLEALLLLEQEQGEAHGAQLARRMGISRASVSITMKQLRQNGYITVDKGHRLCLTDAGRAVAVRIYERHCFFTEMLLRAGVSFATAQRDACRMEHAISEESFAKLRTAMDNKKRRSVHPSLPLIGRLALCEPTSFCERRASFLSIGNYV